MARLNKVHLRLPNDPEYLPVAQAFIRETASRFGLGGSSLGQIEVASEEAVINVIKHTYDVEENDTFEIVCEKLTNGIRVIIKERGIPFDPNLAPRYQPAADIEDADSSGLGIFLMRELVDECTFRNLGPEGKETVLVKYSENAPALPPEPDAAHVPAEPEVIREKLDYVVRHMADHEAIEVSRCAYKSHGYSFFDDHIYYPERLVELNRSGQMISAVAVTKDNRFMGHGALLFQDDADRIAELTFVFVNVEYRGQGALGRMIEFLFNAQASRPLDGIYAYSVANHPFTQKSTARFGINDCGILLATSPASWKFRGIPGDPTQRISVVLSFKYLTPPVRLSLYPPTRHRAMVEKLYRNIGADHDLRVPDPHRPPDPGAVTRIVTSDNESEGCAELYLSQYGPDAVMEVRRLLRRYCLRKYSAINLFLNLGDPGTFHLTGEFEKMGFFFAGILPLARVGDTLMLQYLNNVDLDYGKICAVSDIAREVLAYIRANDPNADL